MMYLICPKCSREFVKRVARQGVAEKLLGLFYIYPFRCQLCGYRFRFLQWGIRYQRIQEDRREYERLAVNCPVSLRGENLYSEGNVTDISLGGCTAMLETQLSAGDLCTIGLYLSNDVLPIRVDAAVVRTARSNSLGIEFIRFRDNDRERLQLFIRGLLRRRVAPSELQSPSLPEQTLAASSVDRGTGAPV
ncbi:MAG TPA: PilZ domain-containing protein [Candidatus Acidoferrales bacterium]|nr:PilZ domain-containing protein [Candidatus Acidoferrales bacterium]